MSISTQHPSSLTSHDADLKLDPRNLAKQLLHEGDFKRAYKYIRLVNSIDPRDPTTRNLIFEYNCRAHPLKEIDITNRHYALIAQKIKDRNPFMALILLNKELHHYPKNLTARILRHTICEKYFT